jgi:hypothetical protein
MHQVQQTFDGLGQLTVEYHVHTEAVNLSSTPRVQ